MSHSSESVKDVERILNHFILCVKHIGGLLLGLSSVTTQIKMAQTFERLLMTLLVSFSTVAKNCVKH